jgi:predicted nuclease of predicted toxin-antitoxin system
LEEAGHTASHWSTIGSLNAPDHEVLLWAKANGYLLFTHDLDFGAILAATEAEGPSVIQIRGKKRGQIFILDFDKMLRSSIKKFGTVLIGLNGYWAKSAEMRKKQTSVSGLEL